MQRRFWEEAAMKYLQNSLPPKAVKGTPYERWFGSKPSLTHICRFGTESYCHNPDEKRVKLYEKTIKFKFVDYSEESKVYSLLDIATGKVTITRGVKLLQ